MKRLSLKGLGCLKFHLIEGFSEEIEHAVFIRFGGISSKPFNNLNVSFQVGDKDKNVVENRHKIMQALNLRYCVSAKQINGNHVLVIDEKVKLKLFANNKTTVEVKNMDALVTNQKQIGLMIQVADCQAILFFDPAKQVLGMAHAGWKGLKQDISGKVIETMKEDFDCNPENILVGIGPSLNFLNNEFSDPAQELGPAFIPYIMKGNKVDLWEFSRQQLISHGIQEKKIENARLDTADADASKWFFSCHREKETGRFAMVAYIR